MRPSVVPVWFIFEGGKVLITPRKHSAFLANVQREPRVLITIDEDQGRYRKVLFEGDKLRRCPRLSHLCAQLLEQCLRVLHVGGVEALGEPAVDFGEHRARPETRVP